MGDRSGGIESARTGKQARSRRQRFNHGGHGGTTEVTVRKRLFRSALVALSVSSVISSVSSVFSSVSSVVSAQRPAPRSEDEATTLLQEYVRLDTSNPPGTTTKAADFLQRILEGEGVP